MIKLDANTFGDSDIASILADILSKQNNKTMLRRVGKLITRFNKVLLELNKMTNLQVSSELERVYFFSTKNLVHSMELPLKVESYLLNYLSSLHKKYLIILNKKFNGSK